MFDRPPPHIPHTRLLLFMHGSRLLQIYTPHHVTHGVSYVEIYTLDDGVKHSNQAGRSLWGPPRTVIPAFIEITKIGDGVAQLAERRT